MKSDKWGAREDYWYDQMIEARWLRHRDGECTPAICDWCKDMENEEMENEETEDK